MFGSLLDNRLILLFLTLPSVLCLPSHDTQAPFIPSSGLEHFVDDAILAALEKHSDPVDALTFLQPESATELAQPRLLHVFGEPEPQWMTEGDKLRLRRRGKKFADITDHEAFYKEQVDASWAGKARQ